MNIQNGKIQLGNQRIFRSDNAPFAVYGQTVYLAVVRMQGKFVWLNVPYRPKLAHSPWHIFHLTAAKLNKLLCPDEGFAWELLLRHQSPND